MRERERERKRERDVKNAFGVRILLMGTSENEKLKRTLKIKIATISWPSKKLDQSCRANIFVFSRREGQIN